MRKSRIIYSLILLLSLTFVYMTGGVVPWSIFYFVLILPVISLINLYIVFKSFTFKEQTNETSYVKGDSIKYTCHLVIEHFLPLAYLTLFIRTPETYITETDDRKELFISSKKATEFTYRVKCRYRGKYDMGIEKMEMVDFLYLFKLSYKPLIKNTVTIYPKIKKVFESATKNVTISQQQLSFYNRSKGDESTINLREYMYGDSSKLIHWKLSAKLDDMLIREKENVLDSHIILAVDLKKSAMTISKRIVYEDLLIEEVIASAHYFITRNIPVDIVFNYNGIKTIHADNVNDFYKIYKILAEVPFSDNADLESVLFDFLSNKEKINTIYIFCLELRKEIINNLMSLRTLGKQLTAKYCLAENKANTYLEINGIANEKLEIAKEKESLHYEK
ncbi:MAG: DUF58 domain-containing protein [Clostridia bacterium]|nr:DUF58 domain-containing protein [Clostridia bacterium]